MEQGTAKGNTQGELVSQLIEESYGTPAALAQQLELALEMLFYLEEDSFSKKEVQGVVSALRGVCGVLRMGE
ncbi:MAG: hypothetical protein COA50_02905 [Flavobacteriaceae bacterium]|nr:MAG: hypothetical protein COA50_02905 [Flavobacteriaceae bacterium]